MKTNPFRFPSMSGSDENDWHEDFEHENGNYHNKCSACGVDFFGHKRRVVCKVCNCLILSRNTGKTGLRNMTDWERKVTEEFIDLMFK